MRLSTALSANIIVVTNTNDSGPGSLRDALASANDGDTIDATGVSGTITLISGQLNVDKDVTISGPGANHLAVDGNGQSRVFYVNRFSVKPLTWQKQKSKTVTIDGLTVGNGYSDSAGIYSHGAALTVSNCTISGNSGGGILNDEGALTVSNCIISGNSGGGISNFGFHGSSPLTITNSTLSGNSADYGGAVLNEGFDGDAMLTITNSTLSGNSASVSGGGIFNGAAGSTGGSSMVTVSDSTISGNSAGEDGGGIYNWAAHLGGSTVAVSNSTISGNSAREGGGIYNIMGGHLGGATLTITNSTVGGNSATGNGGGIYNNSQQGGHTTLTIGNTILNGGASGANISNNSGAVTSVGYNLSSDDGGGYLIAPGDQINTDPMLSPLQDNGGPAFTHELLAGSPAINSGDPSFTPPPSFDQRGLGFGRVVIGRIDIGSFEVQGPTPTPTPSPTPTATPRPKPTPRLRPTPAPRS